MRISVIGTGYVGLVSGVCLAAKGHQVICVDKDPAKIALINTGKSPIYEAGLEPLLMRCLGHSLQATTDLGYAVAHTDISIIAVGTPFDGSQIDLSAIKAAARELGQALVGKDAYHVVVMKSTVVPGTTDDVVGPVLEQASGRKAGTGFGLGMNPEFLREGEAVADFMDPDRIVIGAMDKRSLAALEQLYAPFEGCDIIRTNNKTAEMIKYASNALFATLISYANEIGNLCAAEGDVDVLDVMTGVHLDGRISPRRPDGERVVPGMTAYLRAGCGFGGSCFPKDVKALVAHGVQKGQGMRLLSAVLSVNERQPMEMIGLLRRHFSSLAGLKVGVLGLAFKPGTDDVRESPALPVIRYLAEQGALVKVYDPVATGLAGRPAMGDNVSYASTLAAAVDNSEAVLIMTAWPEFEHLPRILGDNAHAPLVIDGRRILAPGSCARYEGIGVRAA